MPNLRSAVSHVSDPTGQWLHRRGVTADMVTVLGTVVSVAASLFFFPNDHLFWGTVVVTVFVLFDTLDGAVARAAGGGSPFGAVLDSVCDRVADGALFAALVWWCFGPGDDRLLAVVALVCLVSSQVISYIKARAEAAGLTAEGGLIERPIRLIITLVGTGLHGLGVPYAVHAALWLLAVLSLVTVGQRLAAVHRSARSRQEASG
ncbi:MAG TPA: CDP-alcohol phosphatidyltransferase family protein [Pseudonocardiaceae bacterium]